jgi:hypothetical protein
MQAQFCGDCGAPLAGGQCQRCSKTNDAPAAAQQPNYIPSYGGTTAAPPTWGVTPVAWAPPTPGSPLASRYIGQWNWGAFLLSGFWPFFHGMVVFGILYYVLCWIPFVSLIMAIWLGAKGNEMALKNRQFHDEAQFVAIQQAWTRWGFIILVISIGLGIIFGIIGIAASPNR